MAWICAILVLAKISLVLASAGGSGGRAQDGGASPDCIPRKIMGTLKKCMIDAARDSDARATCKTEMEAKFTECGEEKPSASDERHANQLAAEKAMGLCLLAGEAAGNCEAKFKDISGEATLPDANVMNVAVEEGAREALADEISTCMTTAADDASAKAACRTAIKAKLENLRGEAVSDASVDAAFRKAAFDKASSTIRECVEVASDEAARSACLTSDGAKEVVAKVLNVDKSTITDGDLKRAAMEEAKRKAREAMEGCMVGAGNAEAKKECRRSGGVKQAIATSMGLDPAQVGEAMVLEVVNKGMEDKALMAINNCAKGDATKQATCKADAKKLFAEASGRDATEVTDFELKKVAGSALARDLAARMKRCVATAVSDEDRNDCKETVAKKAIQDADVGNKVPSKGEIARMLEASAKQAAREARESCTGTKAECEALVKEHIAAAKGMKKEDVKKLDVKTMAKSAAVDVVKDKVLACIAAKEDDTAARCADMYTEFTTVSGKQAPTDAKKLAIDKKRMFREAAASATVDSMRVCYKMDTKQEADDCLAELKTESDKIVGELLNGTGSQDAKSKKQQRIEREAKRRVIGEVFSDCMKTAQTTDEKNACKTELGKVKANAGVDEDDKALLHRFYADMIANPAGACEGAELKQCRADAKQMAIDSGMKPGEHNVVKGLGEVKAAARVWADCAETGEEDESVCDAEAKLEYLAVSGADGDSYSEKLEKKVRKLGKALKNGVATVIQKKKAFLVGVYTDEDRCANATQEKIEAKLATVVENETDGEGWGPILRRPCRVVDDIPEYPALVAANHTDDKIADAADKVAVRIENQDLDARRLELHARRLLQTTSALAAQAVEECAENDDACTTEEVAGEETDTTTNADDDNAPDGGGSLLSGTYILRASWRCTTLVAAVLFAEVLFN